MAQNVDPLPGSLSTPTSPPIMSTSRLQMDSPSPVPPKRRVMELSAWENGSNRRACLSLSRPMPVSMTAKRTYARSFSHRSRVTWTTILPSSVNLMALLTKLAVIWFSRAGSPNTWAGTSECTNSTISRFFSWAAGLNMLTMSSMQP